MENKREIYEYVANVASKDAVSHHGIKGQKWGRRRYQEEDGSLTNAGKLRYGVGDDDRKSRNKPGAKDNDNKSGSKPYDGMRKLGGKGASDGNHTKNVIDGDIRKLGSKQDTGNEHFRKEGNKQDFKDTGFKKLGSKDSVVSDHDASKSKDSFRGDDRKDGKGADSVMRKLGSKDSVVGDHDASKNSDNIQGSDRKDGKDADSGLRKTGSKSEVGGDHKANRSEGDTQGSDRKDGKASPSKANESTEGEKPKAENAPKGKAKAENAPKEKPKQETTQASKQNDDAAAREKAAREKFQQDLNTMNNVANVANRAANLTGTLKKASDESIKNAPKVKLDLTDMTDAQLRSAINRAQLEQQYNDYYAPSTVSKGQLTVNKMLGALTTGLAVTGSAVSLAVAIKQLLGK